MYRLHPIRNIISQNRLVELIERRFKLDKNRI
jgi:hypothetical protein